MAGPKQRDGFRGIDLSGQAADGGRAPVEDRRGDEGWIALGIRRRARHLRRNYLSTSPTTKKTEPRIAIRSGISVPGRIAGMTLMFEKLAVRIFTR